MNSRLVHGYYVLDGLPSKFNLTLGVGKNSHTVVCQHGGQSSAGLRQLATLGNPLARANRSGHASPR